MLWDTAALVQSVSEWLELEAPRVWADVATTFLSAMLSRPDGFSAAYAKKAKRQEIRAFATIVEIAAMGGLGHLYIFLDQFEELFHGRGKKELVELASSMRQILEACAGLATMVVTLHPSAAMHLRSPEGQSLTTIAPVDDRRTVDLPNITPVQAVHLTQTYIEHSRLGAPDPGNPVFPFGPDCIERISQERDGNIGEILQVLRNCVEAAVEHGKRLIDGDFLERYYREVTGKVSEEELELA